MNCGECDANLIIPEDSMKGEIITCPDCGQIWEFIGKSEPLIRGEKEGEDWGE